MTNLVEKRRDFLPIERSFRKTIFWISLGLIGVFSCLQILQEYRSNWLRLEGHVHGLADALSPQIAFALKNQNDTILKTLADHALKDHLIDEADVMSIAIFDDQHNLRYQNTNDLNGNSSTTISSTIIDDQNGRKHLGDINISVSTEKITSLVFKDAAEIIILNGFKTIFLVVVILWFLNNQVVLPLNALARSIQAFPQNPNEQSFTPAHKKRSVLPVKHVGKLNEIDMLSDFIEKREQRLRQLISDLQAREETLRDSESHQRNLAERLEFIMRANELGSWDITVQTGEAIYNDRWCMIMGLEPKKVTQTLNFWQSRVHSDDWRSLAQAFEGHITGVTASVHNMHRLKHENGHWIWVLCTGTAVARGPDQTASRIVGTNLDISDLVNAREEALAANKSKSEFLANMSHEIRTPLNGVLGMASLLKRTPLDASQMEFIKTIEISGKQLLSVISDILDISKVEAGKFELSAVKMSVRGIIDNTVRIINPAATIKGLIIITEIAPSVPESAYCDDTRLQQVLVNLASNAVKFTAQGQIMITASAKPSEKIPGRTELEFHVIDQGIGIPQEQLKNLFQAFKQADAGVTRKYGGTGLGLAISKQIVGLMQGGINVQSTVGKGSDFYFTIQVPLSVEQFTNTKPPIDLMINHKWSIMIVEGNVVHQKVMTNLMRSVNQIPDIAATAGEASHMASNQFYDLVLIDLTAQESEGVDAAQRIQAHYRSHAKVIPLLVAITTAKTEEVAQKLNALGFADIVEKPITSGSLQQVLRALSERSQHLQKKFKVAS